MSGFNQMYDPKGAIPSSKAGGALASPASRPGSSGTLLTPCTVLHPRHGQSTETGAMAPHVFKETFCECGRWPISSSSHRGHGTLDPDG